jgi:hypothetical protein
MHQPEEKAEHLLVKGPPLLILGVGDRTSGVSTPSVMVFFGAFIDASRKPWRRANKVQQAQRPPQHEVVAIQTYGNVGDDGSGRCGLWRGDDGVEGLDGEGGFGEQLNIERGALGFRTEGCLVALIPTICFRDCMGQCLSTSPVYIMSSTIAYVYKDSHTNT